MKRLKVYLDTSVVSYLYQEDAPEKNAGYIVSLGIVQGRHI